jgi:hypothetical protein
VGRGVSHDITPAKKPALTAEFSRFEFLQRL